MKDGRFWVADASKWQLNLKNKTRSLDLSKAASMGVDGIYIKFMENQHVDAGYELLKEQAIKYFKYWGFYWMHRYDKAWEPQVAMVCDELNKTKPTLPPMADWEQNGYMGKLPARPSIHRIQTEMLRHTRKTTDYALGLYCSQWILWQPDTISIEETVSPLWVSTLNDNINFEPNIGKYLDYFLQQYTSQAKAKDYGFECGTLDLSIGRHPAFITIQNINGWVPKGQQQTVPGLERCDLCNNCSQVEWMARHGE